MTCAYCTNASTTRYCSPTCLCLYNADRCRLERVDAWLPYKEN